MKSVLFIAHTPSSNLRALSQGIAQACGRGIADNTRVDVLSPFDVNSQHILAADGVIILTPENFAYMSGALKDCFDRCYIDLLGKTEGCPYLLIVRAGTDGTGTVQAVESILTGLRWKAVNDALVLQGEFDVSFIEGAAEFAQALVAGVDQGIF